MTTHEIITLFAILISVAYGIGRENAYGQEQAMDAFAACLLLGGLINAVVAITLRCVA